MSTSKPRIRPLLLILLWIWAGCVFLVVDLFWNVPEFDRVRPRAPLYGGMRRAAHEMVGERFRARAGERDGVGIAFFAAEREPARDADTVAEARRLLRLARDSAPPDRAAALAAFADCTGYGARPVVRDALEDTDPAVRAAAVEAIVRAGALDELRLLPPEALAELAARAQAPRSLEQLRAAVAGADTLDARLVALEEMANRYGLDARPDLLEQLRREDAEPRLRRAAARLLAMTGPDAIELLVRTMNERDEPAIQRGVAYGLAELGAAYRLVRLAEQADLRETAIDALGRTRPGPELIRAVRDPRIDDEVRARLVRALGHAGVGASTLTRVLDEKDAASSVRVAAVRALADLHDADLLPTLARACYDLDPKVAESACNVWQRRTEG